MTDDFKSRYMFDKEGMPINMDTHAKLLNDREYAQICENEFEDGAWLSTAWIGIDANAAFEGPPVIFETALLDGSGTMVLGRQRTEDEAREFHHRALMKLMNGVGARKLKVTE